jgi:hypothetical protein
MFIFILYLGLTSFIIISALLGLHTPTSIYQSDMEKMGECLIASRSASCFLSWQVGICSMWNCQVTQLHSTSVQAMKRGYQYNVSCPTVMSIRWQILWVFSNVLASANTCKCYLIFMPTFSIPIPTAPILSCLK